MKEPGNFSMVFKVQVIGILCLLTILNPAVLAQNENSDDLMSAELVKAKVEKAGRMVEAEGTAVFPKFRDKGGEFWFGGGKGYIWIHNLEGIMLVHPAQPELEGTDVLGLKDSSGFAFIATMNDLVKKHGSGWVVYFWAKPGKKITDYKASYVKLVHHGSNNYIIGCGIYNMNEEYIRLKFPEDVIFSSGS